MRHRRNISLSSSSSSSSSFAATSDRLRRQHRSHHVRQLDHILALDPIPLTPLRQLSRHGFDDDHHRRKIWPIMLGVDVEAIDREAARRKNVIQQNEPPNAAAAAAVSTLVATSPTPVKPIQSQTFPQPYDYYTGVMYEHRYYDQVEKDINRSMFHFDITKQYKSKKRAASRLALARIIHTIFSLHTDLHYVQGFHDIASVFLIVCHDPSGDPSHPFEPHANGRGEELAFRLTERLALLHIRDSLRPSLDTVVEVLSLIFPLLRLSDPEVHDFLIKTNVQSFFTLSWILTWFSHNLERYADICRVFDFFLSNHPLMPLYATVALIIQLREGLLALRTDAMRKNRLQRNLSLSSPPLGELPEDQQVEVDLSAVHEYFQHLPPFINLDDLFARTCHLYDCYPPLELIRVEKLNIPVDSPLRLQSDGVDELSMKLDNYLAWKSEQFQREVKAGTWGSTKSTKNNMATPTPQRAKSRQPNGTPSNTKSFYSYPDAANKRTQFKRAIIGATLVVVGSVVTFLLSQSIEATQ